MAFSDSVLNIFRALIKINDYFQIEDFAKNVIFIPVIKCQDIYRQKIFLDVEEKITSSPVS